MKLSKFLVLLLLLLFPFSGYAVDIDALRQAFTNVNKSSPFAHFLSPRILPGATRDAHVMVCLHGYGGDNQIADILRANPAIKDHLISFNFPDYDIFQRGIDAQNTTFGSIKELLPALYVFKKCVIDAGAKRLDVYGFSAGGAALINLIAVLKSGAYQQALQSIGIGSTERISILAAIQKGILLLDAPMKSMDEVLELNGGSADTKLVAQRYMNNGLRPIDNIDELKGLKLNIIVFFQNPDNAVGNRDDQLYIERLKRVNSEGKTIALIADEGGHLGYHNSLWAAYVKLNNEI